MPERKGISNVCSLNGGLRLSSGRSVSARVQNARWRARVGSNDSTALLLTSSKIEDRVNRHGGLADQSLGVKAVRREDLGGQPAIVAGRGQRLAHGRPIHVARQQWRGSHGALHHDPDILQVYTVDARAEDRDPVFRESVTERVAGVKTGANPWTADLIEEACELDWADQE